MMEHILKTTHGATTRMGCRRIHENPEGGNSGGNGEGCSCEMASDQEVRLAVEAALADLE